MYLPIFNMRLNLFLSFAIDRDVILCVLRFVNNIREYCPTLVLCTPTEQLMYFMMVYFTADYVYLEEDINLFLMQQIYVFFKECENIYYDFDTVIGWYWILCYYPLKCDRLTFIFRRYKFRGTLLRLANTISRLSLQRRSVLCFGDGALSAKIWFKMA